MKSNSLFTAFLVASVLFLNACPEGSSRFVGNPPVAALDSPVCAVRGSEVVFDASGSLDSGGQIDRYVFLIGHALPAFIQSSPVLVLRIMESSIIDGRYVGLPVSLSVFDDDGNEDTVERLIYIVEKLEQCDDIGVEQDITVIDVLPDGAGEIDAADVVQPDTQDVQDQVETDSKDVGDSEDLNTLDGPSLDLDITETDSEIVDMAIHDEIDDESITDDTGPDVGPDIVNPPDSTTDCPQISGPYHVKVICGGSVFAELDLNLDQTECEVSDEFGIVSGGFGSGDDLTLDCTFQNLSMDSCAGTVADASEFFLACNTGCTAQYIKQ